MIGSSIVIVGINVAGITSKIELLDKALCDLKPTMWMISETKRFNNQ